METLLLIAGQRLNTVVWQKRWPSLPAKLQALLDVFMKLCGEDGEYIGDLDSSNSNPTAATARFGSFHPPLEIAYDFKARNYASPYECGGAHGRERKTRKSALISTLEKRMEKARANVR